jgi:hypothetical protein
MDAVEMLEIAGFSDLYWPIACYRKGSYEMLRWPMLMRRGNTFYSRVQVPLRLQPMFGRCEVFKSLRTIDPEEAKLLSLKVAAEMKKVFEAHVADRSCSLSYSL